MRGIFLALALVAPLAAAAIGPGEALPDPALEARARGITKELRCVVCQSESIDESNADIARDLRLLVRERITAGDSDDEVLAYVVDRYGEFVLFRPPMTAANAPLWLAGPVMLIFGSALVAAVLRRRAREARIPRDGLSAEEQARLDALMKE
ncbi:cytochrome c-type biogenesis protein [Amaricoccus sp.]|uniref:cytochrome c-type biogenesis protein n=1 Tax=Amaricoccus sp. TaxID=1872485 RepID=UPI001B629482|nr:cytochrome c-type biogenesis protein [Amaricoccus sp.]MBP7002842.1 cytochrome c-type biogenesis protein CcmH [Amaricoccus sp.]